MEHVGLGLITFGVVAEDVEIGAPGWFAFVLALCPVPEEGFADVEPDRRELLVFPVLNVGSGLHFDSEVAVLEIKRLPFHSRLVHDPERHADNELGKD